MHIAKVKDRGLKSWSLLGFIPDGLQREWLFQGGEGGKVNIHSEYPERRVCEERRRERGRREEIF